MLIEQAIFTSARTARADGYQLVAHSSGISEPVANELTVWGPSHDSLIDPSGRTPSTSFFRLSNGQFCIARTVAGGAEFSGRGGPVVYTHFLVASPELLARFSNNPFALVRAAAATGAMRPRDPLPVELDPLRIGGRAAAADMALVAQLARNPGPAAIGTLVQAALSSDRLAIGGRAGCEALVAGLFSVLPIECRTEFSFTTGLKISPARPVRLAALPVDRAIWPAIDRQGYTLADLDAQGASECSSWQGWAGFVAAVLAAGKLSTLSAELERARPWLTCDKLDLVGKQANAALHVTPRPPAEETKGVHVEAKRSPANAAVPFVEKRADASHARRQEMIHTVKNYAIKGTVEELAETLAGQPPEVLELLERIDDLVFTAIGGDERALVELEVLWPTVAGELEPAVIEQSREQYLRSALTIWGECVEGNIRRPERAVAAIDVLCVLFEQ